MRRESIVLLALASLAGCLDQPLPTEAPATPEPAPPSFALIVHDITELPTLGGGPVRAEDINDFGQVVGHGATSDGVVRAILWENGSMQDLGALGGTGSGSQASAVNDLAQVVGASNTSAGPQHAFLWENGAMQDLGTLGGGFSVAFGINDRRQVVGESHTSSGQRRAFLWENGAMQDLGTLGGSFSFAVDINDLGQVVGSTANGAGAVVGFLWDKGAMQGIFDGNANAINDLGQVVGTQFNSLGRPRAVLWMNGAMQDLGTLGGTSSSAQDINDLGQVVGTSSNSSGDGRAFLWMDGTMFSLGGLPGSLFTTALDINNQGEVTGISLQEGLDDRTVVWSVPIRPPVDIEPADATNTIRLTPGSSISVAILGTPYFNVEDVDPRTITLGDETGADSPVTRKRNGDLEAEFDDVDHDGDMDLVLQFQKRRMMNNGDLTSITTELVLLGERTDGRALRAVEPVTVR